MLKNCIIGYTGFVGTNIIKNNDIFDEFYNSSNINDIKDNYNIILFTGLSGHVGNVNKNHIKDLENVMFFINKLKNIKCNKFILISTINVYHDLNCMKTEDEILEINNCKDYYGKHRLIFEKFIIENYTDYHILRLPSIYGDSLKKGILFDLINDNFLENICIDDEIQFYDLEDINDHIKYVCDNNIKICNLVSEPLYVNEIIKDIFPDFNKKNITMIKREPKKLNICSKYFENRYIYNNNISLEKIKKFVKNINKLLVIIPLYNINKHYNENNNTNNTLYKTYEEMYKISYKSYLNYNDNIQIKKLESKKILDNYSDMFKNIIEQIINIHFFEKRDILYVESDTMCFNKLNFDNIDKLLMFNLGISCCDIFNMNMMMNSGIIYIPKKCNLDYNYVINVYNSLYDNNINNNLNYNLNYNEWIKFEKFWNILYYKQFISFEESIEYNKYIGIYNFLKSNYILNNKDIRSLDFFINKKPVIIHINGSRGSENCLRVMNNINNYIINNIHNIDYNIIYNELPLL